MKMDKKHLATISVLVKDREVNSPELNQILTDHGHLILARLGVNVQRHCVEHCTGLITIVVEATVEEIRDLTEKMDGLYGVVAKKNVLTE